MLKGSVLVLIAVRLTAPGITEDHGIICLQGTDYLHGPVGDFQVASRRQMTSRQDGQPAGSSELPGWVALASVLTTLRPNLRDHTRGLGHLSLLGSGGAPVRTETATVAASTQETQ